MKAKMRAPRRKQSKGKLAFLLPILVMLIGALVLFKKKDGNKPGLSSVDGRAIVDTNAEPNQKTIVPSASKKERATKVAAVREPDQALNDAGLKSAGYVIDGAGKKNIRLQIQPQGVCHSGDYEAIVEAVGERGRILLSIEPLDLRNSGKARPQVKAISLAEIKNGITVDLKAETEGNGAFGLFLCSDKMGKQSCNGKPVADFNGLISRAQSVDRRRDFVFYFQTIILKSEYSLVYGGDASALPRAKSALLDDAEVEGKKIEASWSDVVQYTRRARSLPPQTAASGEFTAYIIPVARFDERTCVTK